MQTVSWPDAATTIETRSYDPGSRLVGIDRGQFDETRTYDSANWLTAISNLKPDEVAANQIGTLNYTYDANGNKLSETWSGGPSGLAAWNFSTVDSAAPHSNGYDEEDRVARFIRNASGTPFPAASDISLDRTAPGSSGSIGNIKSITGAPTQDLPDINGTRSYSDTYELTSFGSGPLNQSYNLDGNVAIMHSGIELTWDASQRMKSAQQQNWGHPWLILKSRQNRG